LYKLWLIKTHKLKSYPFNFSIRDLYARVKEDPRFQQTATLMQFREKTVTSYSLGKDITA
jgi:hypothetical protein